MNLRYTRNRIYISKEEQAIIKDYSIILGGSGIGSVIAECLLRLGFENLTIIDGDQVELSNLNRQNYLINDIGKNKVDAVKRRLLDINPDAKITSIDYYLTPENITPLLEGHSLAVNALDFTSGVPLIFDKLCQESKIPVLHPYNLGWGALVAIIFPDGLSLDSIAKPDSDFNEVNVVEYATSYSKFWGKPHNWLSDAIEMFKNEKEKISPPQLAIGSYLVASMCTHLIFDIAVGKKVKQFPDFYLKTTTID